MLAVAEKRDYFTGDPLPVTREWQQLAEDARMLLGLSKRKLASMVPCSHSAIAELLKSDRVKTSALVGPVSRILDIPRPAQMVLNNREALVLEAMHGMTEAEPEALLMTALAMAAKK